MKVKFSKVKVDEVFGFLGEKYKKTGRNTALCLRQEPPYYQDFNENDVVYTEPRNREIWICPHQYSCGGYYMAEKFKENEFWLLSGREVLSEYQAKQGLQYCRERGEIITEVWADLLPEGSKWLNLRGSN